MHNLSQTLFTLSALPALVNVKGAWGEINAVLILPQPDLGTPYSMVDYFSIPLNYAPVAKHIGRIHRC